MAGARIYAENAIRCKSAALNYLRLSSRIDAVAQRVNSAIKMKCVRHTNTHTHIITHTYARTHTHTRVHADTLIVMRARNTNK